MMEMVAPVHDISDGRESDDAGLGAVTSGRVLLRAGKLEGEVAEQALPGNVGHRAEDNHRTGEAGMTKADSLVGGKLGHRLTPDEVLPVVLKRKLVTAASEILFVRDLEIGGFLAEISAVEI